MLRLKIAFRMHFLKSSVILCEQAPSSEWFALHFVSYSMASGHCLRWLIYQRTKIHRTLTKCNLQKTVSNEQNVQYSLLLLMCFLLQGLTMLNSIPLQFSYVIFRGSTPVTALEEENRKEMKNREAAVMKISC